jgi:hypothetical protein
MAVAAHDQLAELSSRELYMQGDGRRSDARRTQDAGEEEEACIVEEGNPIARAQPQLEEPRRACKRGALELAIEYGAVREDECLPLRNLARGCVEELAEIHAYCL